MRNLNKHNKPKVDEIEKQLHSSLKPISPRLDYIQNLHLRLTDRSQLEVTYYMDEPLLYFLFGFAGVAGTVLIIISIIRLFLSLLSIFGLLRYSRRHKNQETLATTHSSPAM